MKLRTGPLAGLAVLVAALAAAVATLLARRRPGAASPGRRSARPDAPGAADLTDRPVPRSVAALSTPPHVEQEPDRHS